MSLGKLVLMLSANDLENRLLPNDLIVNRNQEVGHGEHVGHQEGVGESRKHAQHGGSPSQFGIQESIFKSNLESYEHICIPVSLCQASTSAAGSWSSKRSRTPLW
jgi:hypothetical protein